MDVCDIFHQVAVERAVKGAIDETIKDRKEHVVAMCKDGRIYSETGDTNMINGKILEKLYNSCNREVSLHLHTHPHDTGYPSMSDIRADAFYKPEHDCIWGEKDNKIYCYKAKGELAELGEKKRKLYDEWDELQKINYESLTRTEKEKYTQQFIDIRERIGDLRNKQDNLIIKEYSQYTPKITVTRSNPFIGRYIDIYEPNCPLDNILPGLASPMER